MTIESAAMIKEAVEQHPLASVQGIWERLFSHCFNGFVYNQIWEDPRVDLQALNIDSDSTVLTISSGGCNILNYLVAGPRTIHAVDLNRHHVHFAKLKLAALEHLPTYESFLNFFGYANKETNIKNYYQYIQPRLDEQTQRYWENEVLFWGPRLHYFAKNLYNYGLLGYFIRFVNILARCLGADPKYLLDRMESNEREELFESRYSPFFDRWIIRFLGRLPFLFYGLGIPPQQFRELKKEANGCLNSIYKERVKRLACQFPIEENYFAWQAFCRQYDCENQAALPDYLKRAHYKTIREELANVHLHLISTTEFLKGRPANSLNRFVLLDSQDWMDANDIAELWTEIARTGAPGSRIIFRTVSSRSPVEDSLPADLRSQFVYEREQSQKLFENDRSAVYGGFHLYRMIT